MKKIILLISILFISVVSFAQQNISIYDLLEYKKECYNDSTEVWYYMVCDWSCTKVYCQKSIPNEVYISSHPPCKSEWIHKQPTFDGFVIWIEKKYSN